MSLISGQSTRISNMLSSSLVGAAEVRALQADANGQAQILTSTLNALTAEAKKGIESINETAISAQKDILNNIHWDTRAWPSRHVVGWLGKGIERILIGSGWLAPNFTVDFEHLDIALEGFMTPGWARALLALACFVWMMFREVLGVAMSVGALLIIVTRKFMAKRVMGVIQSLPNSRQERPQSSPFPYDLRRERIGHPSGSKAKFVKMMFPRLERQDGAKSRKVSRIPDRLCFPPS
ncbi:unnamed protein product [Cyclocybe aegerita]|uniref:Uncharacterized protein n=1 Tax=Cyclocybe aegerita TaxID=1973307 RepID=A0A8S0W5R5_CYCAE|nr:unnamed protein product [Cyclocybe aegerita]